MPAEVAQVPTGGGMNTTADPATVATSLLKNVSLGPAGENTQRAGLVDYGVTGLGTSPVIGEYPWRDWLVLVTQDRKIWATSRGAPTVAVPLSDATAATQLAGSSRPVFAEDGLPRLVIAGGNAPQQWTGAGLTSTLVASGRTPAATHIAYLGQRLIANDVSTPTQWYWSDLGDGSHTAWQASSFTTADAAPDGIVAIYANLRQLYVFGEKTLQVYAVGTDPLNPFDNVMTSSIGCAAAYSPVEADGNWVWLDNRRRIGIGNELQFQDLSSDITKTLRALTTVDDCWGHREDVKQGTLYVFTFPTEGREFVLDFDKKAWSEREYQGGPMPVLSHAYWPLYNIRLFGSSTTGALYKLDEDTRTDLGNPLTFERTTGWVGAGNSRKRSVRVRLRLRRGTGGASGTPDSLEIRKADDGGPWEDWEQVSIGLGGENDQTQDAFLSGIFRQRRYHVRYSGTQDTALLGIEEHYQELDS